MLRFRSVKGRMVLAVLAALSVGLGGLSAYVWWQESLLARSAERALRDREYLFTEVEDLTGRTLARFARDYSRWDQAVAFVATNDQKFVDEQLAPGMETFDVDMAWVLRADCSTVRVVDRSEQRDLAAPPWPAAVLPGLLAGDGWFRHFYAPVRRGLLDVRVAPIQPDADLARATPPRGFLVVARLLDRSRLASLGNLARVTVRVVPPGGGASPAAVGSDGRMSFVRAAPGWDGRPAAWFVVSASGERGPSADSARVRLAVLGGAFVLAIVVGLFGLRRWVTLPLSRVRRSLDQEDPAQLGDLAGDEGEFGALARVLQRYFAQQQELVRQARNDPLTGLPNRTLLDDRLAVALSLARRHGSIVGVLLLDLDEFKGVNDTLGHDAGDAVLKETAARLSGVLRSSDTVARLGGDEFVVVLPELVARADAEIVARRILEVLARPFVVREQDVRLGTSIGIAFYPDDGDDGAKLLPRADEAMYRAKKRGKGRFAFAAQAESTGALERAAFLAEIQTALEAGTVGVRYLPRIDLASGATTGAAACIYWRRDDGEVLQACDLLRLAEETGTILVVEDLVLRTAAADLLRWRAQGLEPVPISVRLSSRRIVRPANVEEILRLVGGAGAAPGSFELRVPETVLQQQPVESARSLQRLHDEGFLLAVDDFGLAVGSLNHLRELPLDVVQFGRELGAGLEPGSDAAALLAAVATLAGVLGRLCIVAPAVPDAAHLALVRSLGCHAAFDPAVPEPLEAGEFAARLAGRRAGG